MRDQNLSVENFKETIAGLPEDEQKKWIRIVYRIAQTEWTVVNKKQKLFLIRFIESDLQGFLDYLREDTFWGQFIQPIKDPELSMMFVYHLLKLQDRKKVAGRILACSLLLLFGSKWKISTMLQYLKVRKITPGDILDLMAWVNVKDER